MAGSASQVPTPGRNMVPARPSGYKVGMEPGIVTARRAAPPGASGRLALAAAVLVLAAPAAPGQEGAAPAFALTQAALDELAAEVRPLVAEALDAPSVRHVPVRSVDRAELQAVVEREGLPLARAQVGLERAPAAAREAAALLAPALLAKYSHDVGAVLVAPENVSGYAELVGRAELLERETLAAVLVHELVHAADQERHDYAGRLAGLHDLEAVQALLCVVEGHAQHVARALCAERGWSRGFRSYTDAIGALPDRELDAGTRLVLRAQLAVGETTYVAGERFVAALEAAGGERAVARAFRDPPAELELIHHPEWYLDPDARPARGHDLDALLDGVAADYAERTWTHLRTSLTRAQRAVAFELLGEATCARLEDEIADTRVLVLRRASSPELGVLPAQVTVGLFATGSPAQALFLAQANEELLRRKDEALREGAVRIVAAVYEPLRHPLLEGVLAWKEVANGPVTIDVATLTAAARGTSLVLEIVQESHPAEASELVARAAALAAAAGAVPHPDVAALDPAPAPRGRVEGRVLDDETGAPVAGCTVRLDAVGWPVPQATTDADGRFALERHARTRERLSFDVPEGWRRPRALELDAEQLAGRAPVEVRLRSRR